MDFFYFFVNFFAQKKLWIFHNSLIKVIFYLNAKTIREPRIVSVRPVSLWKQN